MDLSKFKWPVIILVVVAGGWLLSEGGVNYMFNKFSSGTPGQDAEQDKINEAGLTRLGGYLVLTFRYAKAKEVLQAAIQRYPGGENVWYNYYRMAKCEEKLENYKQAAEILAMLIRQNAGEHDTRIATNDILKGRLDRLVEVHDLAP